jgi:PAS domain S-box-containing protein
MTKPPEIHAMVRSRAETPSLTRQECSHLIQELSVYQVELEMRNEELRTAQIALDSARARYFYLYDLAPVGYCTLDASGSILEANPKAASLLCRTVSTLRNQPISRFVHLSERARFHVFQRTLMATGRESSCEMRMVDQNGKPFWSRMDAWVPEWASGQRLFYLTLSDITLLKLAEEQQSIAAATFESNMGKMVTDAKGLILKVNRAFTKITGYTQQDMLGKKPSVLQSGRHDAAFYQALWADIEQTGHWEGEIWNKRKNGEIYPQWLDIFAVKAAFGQVTHYVGGISDISAQVKANAELQAIQARMRFFALKQQEDFDQLRAEVARDVHDELGQVLTALKLEIEMIAAVVPEAAQQMQRLVKKGVASVREVSRALRPAALELGLVPALRTIAAEISMRSDVDIRANLAGKMPKLSAQMERLLFRIAQEALTNAANHAQARTIALNLQFEDNQLELAVVDDGLGFDLTAPLLTCGLGIVGMQERAQQMGAHLDLESAPGCGTRIAVRLPESLLGSLA